METSVKLILNNDDMNFTSGLTSYENLQKSKNSDRYQYIYIYICKNFYRK